MSVLGARKYDRAGLPGRCAGVCECRRAGGRAGRQACGSCGSRWHAGALHLPSFSTRRLRCLAESSSTHGSHPSAVRATAMSAGRLVAGRASSCRLAAALSVFMSAEDRPVHTRKSAASHGPRVACTTSLSSVIEHPRIPRQTTGPLAYHQCLSIHASPARPRVAPRWPSLGLAVQAS